MAAAERLVRTRGYSAISYADLAEAVGIRKASIHHHFPAKSDLAKALIERYSERFFEALEEIARRNKSGGGRLKAYLRAYRDGLAGGDLVCLCVAFSAGRDGLSESVLARMSAFTAYSLGWLKETFRMAKGDGTIRDVGPPAAEASACLALVEGAQLRARAARDVTLFEDAIALLTRRIG